MGIQSSFPPTVGQAQSEPSHHTGPELMQPRSSPRPPSLATVFNDTLDQSMYRPNYTWQPYQPDYPAVPIPAKAPPSVMQHCVYPPPRSQAQNVPTREIQTCLPLGSFELNGTTYFPTSMRSAPAPPPVTYPVPLHPASFNHTMAPIYPYYAPTTQPAGYYDIPTQTTDVAPQTSFDPFGSDPMMPSELPVIPQLEDYQISPMQLPLPLSSPPVPNGDLGLTTPAYKRTITPEHEFPYRPPKDQQVGHARRISVTIKKHGRANSG